MSPQELRGLIVSDEEFALVDVREQGAFARSHLLFAVCVPLSRLELLVDDLVPRRNTRLVVPDSGTDNSGTAGRPESRVSDANASLKAIEYVAVLEYPAKPASRTPSSSVLANLSWEAPIPKPRASSHVVEPFPFAKRNFSTDYVSERAAGVEILFCCSECVGDNYLDCQVFADAETGACSMCETDNVRVVEARQLASYFELLKHLYYESHPEADAEPRWQHNVTFARLCQADWFLFPKLDDDQATELLVAIFGDPGLRTRGYTGPVHHDYEIYSTGEWWAFGD